MALESRGNEVDVEDVAVDSGSDSDDGGSVSEISVEDEQRPLCPLLVILFLTLASFSMTVPYISQIAMEAPYSLKARVIDAEDCEFDDACFDEEVIIRSQTIVSVTHSTAAFFELFSTGVLGVLCDRIGTKPVAVFSQLGQLFRLVTMTLCSKATGTFPVHVHNVFWALIVAHAVTGICGPLKIPVQATIARISTPENSARNFGKSSAAVGLAFVAGPLLNVILKTVLQVQVARIPLIVGCLLNATALLLICFCWPRLHSNPADRVPWANAMPCLMIRSTILASLPLMMYSAIFFIDGFGQDMMHSAFMVFSRAAYRWGSTMLSLLMMMQGTVGPLVLTFVLPWILRRFGDRFALRLGSVAILAGLLMTFLIGLTTADYLFFTVTIPGGVGMILNPVLMGLACREMPKEGMGRLAGAVGFIETIAKFIAPLLTGYVMKKTLTGPVRSAVFLVAAAVVVPGVLLAFVVRPKPKSIDDEEEEEEDSH